jgi:peptidoglycan/xylan/chitin deacetylase (PgdA/CDA1 family)
VRHYGITSERAKRRVLACVELVERFDARPMFAVPGRVVDQEPAFFRSLAERGVELAPHGYDHLDFRTLSTEEARSQFERAGDAYERAGIPFTGFRCPYLSFTPELEPLVPDRYAYASHLAIRWDVPLPEPPSHGRAVTEQLASFYRAEPAAALASRPRAVGRLIEVPAALPDDFELTMGLRASADEIADVWSAVWEQVDARGELFAPLFHPEAYDHCAPAFERVLASAAGKGDVWLATTGEIAAWWLERARSDVEVTNGANGLRLELRCAPAVTVLVRGVDSGPALEPWHAGYAALRGTRLELPGTVRPFVGVAQSVPAAAVACLREEGFVVVEDADPATCSVFLDGNAPFAAGEVELVRHVEEAAGPLVRFWRWPNGARSAISIAGDLDALRLTDYLARFRAR